MKRKTQKITATNFKTINILEHTMDNLKVAHQRNDVNYPPTHYQLPTRNRPQVCQPKHDTENASEENS